MTSLWAYWCNQHLCFFEAQQMDGSSEGAWWDIFFTADTMQLRTVLQVHDDPEGPVLTKTCILALLLCVNWKLSMALKQAHSFSIKGMQSLSLQAVLIRSVAAQFVLWESKTSKGIRVSMDYFRHWWQSPVFINMLSIGWKMMSCGSCVICPIVFWKSSQWWLRIILTNSTCLSSRQWRSWHECRIMIFGSRANTVEVIYQQPLWCVPKMSQPCSYTSWSQDLPFSWPTNSAHHLTSDFQDERTFSVIFGSCTWDCGSWTAQCQFL